MPYGSKRNYRSKRRFSKRRGSKRGPTVKSVNRKVKKIQDMIELKYEDAYFNDTVGEDGSDILLLNGIATGSNINRVGNEVMATSLQIRGQVTTNDATIESTRVRCIVFWDRQANGAAPVTLNPDTITNRPLLNTETVTDVIIAPYNYEQQDRYTPLYDKVWTLNSNVVQATVTGATTELVPVTYSFKKFIKLGRKVKYDGSQGTIADIATNSLYVVFYSDQSVTLPTVGFGSRFYFKDA